MTTSCHLEALWWAADMAVFTSGRDKSQRDCTTMLMVPAWISGEVVDNAICEIARKRAPAALGRVRLGALHEGQCVQTLAIGPDDDGADVLAELHEHVIPSQGFQMTGKHHEIYLSDARRVEPARLRTILRQPVLPT